MSFWMGMARAYEQADQKKTEDRRINEQRAFEAEQVASDRKWQEDFFFRKLSAETTATRQNTLLEGLFSGGGSRRSGSGGGSSESEVPLEALIKAFPELDPDTLAELTPYPNAIGEVYKTLTEKRQAYADSRQAWTPEMTNSLVRDIVGSGEEEITPERIAEISDMYGVNPMDEIYPGAGTTWGEAIQSAPMSTPEATVITNPIPDPLAPEQERLVRDTVKSSLSGYLTKELDELNAEYGTLTDPTSGIELTGEQQNRVTQLQQEKENISSLLDQVTEQGFVDEALNSEYGTEMIQSMWESGNQIEYQRLFPMFQPHFPTKEAAEAALATGFIKPGQRIKVLDGGTYRSARF